MLHFFQVVATVAIPFIAIGITEFLKRRRHTRKYKYKYKYLGNKTVKTDDGDSSK